MFASQYQIKKPLGWNPSPPAAPLSTPVSFPSTDLFPLFLFRWACFGQWLCPAAQVHPPGIRQPAHLALTYLWCRNVHVHGEQLQRHWRGVRWPGGLGWAHTTGCFIFKLKHKFCIRLPSNVSHSFKGSHLTVLMFYLESFWQRLEKQANAVK